MSPVELIQHDKLTPAEKTTLRARVIEARRLLASYDPLGESMEVLAAAGIFNVKMSGETPTGVRFKQEGGAEPPPKKSRTKRQG